MPISVLCPGCKARFSVSEKFAGKKGPCPKCKVVITVPAATAEDIKIHTPEEFAGGKDAKGRPTTKPVAFKSSRFSLKLFAVGCVVCSLVFAAAYVGGRRLSLDESQKLIMAGAGLAILSPVLAAVGYTFLRNDELEPYRGRSLWIRSAICSLVYAALWGAYAILAHYKILTPEPYTWMFAGPAFVAVGATAAFAALDLDFASAAFHYCFFLAVTMLLRFAMDYPWVWSGAS